MSTILQLFPGHTEITPSKRRRMKKIAVVSLRLVRHGYLDGPQHIANSNQAAEIAHRYIRQPDREHVAAIYLDASNQPVSIETVAIGSMIQAHVQPREILRTAVVSGAASVILAHNHPSGQIAPSKSDRTLTKDVTNALKLVEIRLLDHLILGNPPTYYSMADHGDLGTP